MGNLKNPKYNFLYIFQFLIILQIKVSSYQYKIGNLDAWGIPSSSNPHIYSTWPQKHVFKIGDSLFFLYPPSEDSVIQITEESYNSCNIEDPILYMNNGNSLFNITSLGEFYFTSGEQGHCEKKQKIQISVSNGSAISPSSLPDTSPSYNPVFGNIPAPPSSSPSSSLSVFAPAIVGFAAFLFNCKN